MAASTTVLERVPSGSRPGHSHEVRIGKDHVLYCTCESWKFSRPGGKFAPKDCKHVRGWLARAAAGWALAPAPAHALPMAA
jgi:hypothetical protein